MLKIYFSLFLLFCFWANPAAVFGQGNHVPSSGEAAIYSDINLNVSSGLVWTSERSATPGYYTLIGSATLQGAADNTTYLVDGYVKHVTTTVNQSQTFPVGAGTDLRSLQTSGTIPSGMEVATAWIPGDPGSTNDPTSTGAAGGFHATTQRGTGITGVSTVGQWDWQDVSGTANGVTITISIPDLTAFASAGSLRLVGWNGTQWVNLSGSTGASGNTENSTLSGTMINGISAIGIGKGSLELFVKVYLQGAWSSSNMTSNLATSLYMPANQPFNTAYFGNYNGGESNASLVTNANVTDWVLVELRSTVSGAPVAVKSGILGTNGIIIDASDGNPGLRFNGVNAGDYYIIIRHRNHLAVVSSVKVTLPNTNGTMYDFTTSINKAMDNGLGTSMKQVSTGVWAMWYGDLNQDQVIDALDNSFMTNQFRQGLIDGYHIGDINFDGFVDAIDRSFIRPVYRTGIYSPLF